MGGGEGGCQARKNGRVRGGIMKGERMKVDAWSHGKREDCEWSWQEGRL
jgi:hypothetical protein